MTSSRTAFTIAIVMASCTALQAQDRSIVLSYMTDSAPTIDGEIEGDEWDAAGPWITVTQDSPGARAAVDLMPSDPFGGDTDLSFRFKSMWLEESANFFLVYEVFDDIAMDDDPLNLWERDQIETFFDGTNLEGDDDINSFHWWDNEETYGKLGVSRYNTFEGNSGKMTDVVDDWDDGFAPDLISVSAAADIGTNADYRVELAVSLIPMLDDFNFTPFDGTPTDEAGHIVVDSTQIKYTVSVSDDDNFLEEEVERSSVITYYREIDGVEGAWDQSTSFADLLFTGEFDGVIAVPGDCNADGSLTSDDLACQSPDTLDDTLASLGLIAGDFDANGAVEFADFLVLSENFGEDGKNYTEGNSDAAGAVEFADFLILSENFGKTSGGEVAAVPEPSAAMLLGYAGLLITLVRRRSR